MSKMIVLAAERQQQTWSLMQNQLKQQKFWTLSVDDCWRWTGAR
ncbi:hypothetical protein PR003_g13257 [Phytophthora rubi]|uniref:Uncharacterized protein n=1 Tax=Phytophthora rubi TaxID=129364 RepID=A0A6A4F753_9STRA|nr:hypothetical protein PR003_g13257 [Phytophthora rubi]